MQLRALFAILAVTAGLSIAPAYAQTVTPCEVHICMASISGAGATGGPACAPALAYWHAPSSAGLVVWTTYGFVAPASAALRRTYLSICNGSNVATNATVLKSINSLLGYMS